MPVKTKTKSKLLVPREMYLSAGVHIGMTSKTADMKRFIYKVRPNGLAVLNVGILDKRIGYIGKMLAKKEKILVVSRKESGQDAAKRFAEIVGAKAIAGRFMPGSLTNPTYREFFEPEVLISLDPAADTQAIKEAANMRIPIVALCDTFNETSFVDIVLPCNNKGKKAVALVMWLLAKIIQEERGLQFSATVEEFGYQ